MRVSWGVRWWVVSGAMVGCAPMGTGRCSKVVRRIISFEYGNEMYTE